MRAQFTEAEFEQVGLYPGMKSVRAAIRPGMKPMEIPPAPKFNTPVTPKENLRLLLSGKKPYWIPRYAVVGDSDISAFRPRENGDNIVNHQIFDGGDYFDYTGLGNVMLSSWFEIIWEYIPECAGATVRPGSPKIADINKWEEVLKFPDLDSIDWEACGKRNKEYLAGGKFNTLGIQCGLWERLISLMDCDRAAIAMIDEDQKEAVKRLFDKLTDFYIDYIGRIKKVCDIDCVLIHEDWAHQNGPFFSPGTAREMLVPYMRRIADFCHGNDMFFEHHCCGSVKTLIEPMLETGADFWCGQQLPVNDNLALAKQYKDRSFAFGVPLPAIPENADTEEMERAAKEFVDEYGDCKLLFYNMVPNIPNEYLKILYKTYRMKFWDYEY